MSPEDLDVATAGQPTASRPGRRPPARSGSGRPAAVERRVAPDTDGGAGDTDTSARIGRRARFGQVIPGGTKLHCNYSWLGPHDRPVPGADVQRLELGFFAAEARLETHVIAGAGHALNLHRAAPRGYRLVRDWLDRRLAG